MGGGGGLVEQYGVGMGGGVGGAVRKSGGANISGRCFK